MLMSDCPKRAGRFSGNRRLVNRASLNCFWREPALLCHILSMALPPDLSFTDSLTSVRRIAFYEDHKSIALAIILIVFLLPFVGIFVSGLFGAVLCVIISVLCYYLAPYVVIKLSSNRDR